MSDWPDDECEAIRELVEATHSIGYQNAKDGPGGEQTECFEKALNSLLSILGISRENYEARSHPMPSRKYPVRPQPKRGRHHD